MTKTSVYRLGTLLAAGLLVLSLLPGSAAAQTPAPTTRPHGVTWINYHEKGITSDELLKVLSEQGAVDFAVARSPDVDDPDKAVDFTNKPFWPAVFQVLDMWDLRVLGQDGFRPKNPLFRLQAYDAKVLSPLHHCDSDDGFVVLAANFHRDEIADYGLSAKPSDVANLNLSLFVDPATQLASFIPAVKLSEAVDDLGKSMIPDRVPSDKASRQRFAGLNRAQLVYHYPVRLKYRDNPAKKIVRIKGTILLQVVDEAAVLSVDKPTTAGTVSKKFGAVTLTFQSMKPVPGAINYAVTVNVSGDASVLDVGGLMMGAKVYDDKDNVFINVSDPDDVDKDGNYTLTYHSHDVMPVAFGGKPAKVGADGVIAPPEGPAPNRWTIQFPVKVHVVEVPFEFRDLPLPGGGTPGGQIGTSPTLSPQ